MNKITLPNTPKGYQLKKAFLSTFDLDENILLDIIETKEMGKFLIARGDGEYIPLKEKDHPIKDRIVDIFFESTSKKLVNNKKQPIKYHHAKIWLFIYENNDGKEISKLIIQSKNIYPYDSYEIAMNFVGEKGKEKINKNNPLVEYFSSLLPFVTDEKKDFISYLVNEVAYYSFTLENDEYQFDDFSFITPNCENAPLLKEKYDEILIVSPFINVETINDLLVNKKEGGRCIIISQEKINESLILSDVKDVIYISPNIFNKFVHSKIYLVRKGNIWDLYTGSMNLSTYSVSKNIEALVHLQNIKNIKSIEGFIEQYFGVDVTEEINQYSKNIVNKELSPIFVDALRIENRIKYIKKLVVNKKYEEGYMNQISSYLLSYQCEKDLLDLINHKKEIIPTRIEITTGKNKKRYVYKHSFVDNTLFGLINFCLHKYDYLLSKNVFLHVADRSIENAFIKIHECKDFKDYYIFKTDIRNFDPSINKEILCKQIDTLLHFDKGITDFLKAVIKENRYHLKDDNKVYQDDIIHQTGLPLAGFLENVYLYDVDFILEKAPIYLRCGDDILIGSKDKKEVEEYKVKTISLLNEKKLIHSEEKTTISSPKEKINYLGWNIFNGEIDFSDGMLNSIEKTIKKKRKDLLIMYGKSKIPHALRLPSIIRYVNHYQKSDFFINAFRVITTTEGLKQIDKMIMDLIRSVVSGKIGNTKYKIKYTSIQAFGYKSLVNQYYEFISSK